jgi:fatty acid CoA ligase FadD32
MPEFEGPLLDHLVARAGSDAAAFTYLDCSSGRGAVPHTLSWRELYARVRAVSARLRPLIERGDRVAVLADQDLDYVAGFLGTLHAGAVAVPLFAPSGGSRQARLVGALVDCDARVWLTSERLVGKLRAFEADGQVPSPAEIIAVDTLPPEPAEVAVSPLNAAPGPENGAVSPLNASSEPAYLQYTSGSTRDPAGAVITHGALVASCRQVAGAYRVDETVTCAGWIPFFHDMGLIQLLALPVYTGSHSVFFPPLEFIRRPIRWLEQLSNYPNVFTAAPNFAYDLAVQAIPEAARAGLDLSGVQVALNGSEPVRPATIAAFDKAFGPHGFPAKAHEPSYGLAEATVYVASSGTQGPTITAFDREQLAAGHAVVAEGGREVVSVGRPFGQLVRIVDRTSRTELPDGEVGEIWVHGPHIAAGYWRQPERTAETFDAQLAEGTPAGGWLRTGDLGVRHDGLLYLTGRIKDLIIIDGKNHYPQDIEATVADAHPAIRRGRVAAFEVDGETGAVGVVVAERTREADTLDVDAVTRSVRRAVAAEHDLALGGFRLLEPGTVPRTSSGKVARSAARARYLAEHETGSVWTR